MKNLITGIACLLLLLAVLTEFTHSQILYSRVMEADRTVNCFRETVRMEGYVSEHSKKWVREELAEILKCRPEEIAVSGTAQPEEQGSLISYSISAPMGEGLAMAGFWDVDEDGMQLGYQVRQYVTSACDTGTGNEEPDGGSSEERGGEP